MEPNVEKDNTRAWPDGEARRRALDQEIRETRARISHLAEEVNAHRTGVAMAMGLGVFLMLLGAGSVYDLVSGKAAVWATLGVTPAVFPWIAAALGTGALLCFGYAALRRRAAGRQREAELDALEEHYAELLEQRERLQALSQPSE